VYEVYNAEFEDCFHHCPNFVVSFTLEEHFQSSTPHFFTMCRWFAYISPTEPCLLSDVLITPANSISKQCSEHYLPKLLPHGDEKELDHTSDELLRMRNALLNMDGLGIACTSPFSRFSTLSSMLHFRSFDFKNALLSWYHNLLYNTRVQRSIGIIY
jgi:hypothetical protein